MNMPDKEQAFHRYGAKLLTDARAATDQKEAIAGADPAGTLTFMQNAGIFNPADIPAGAVLGTGVARPDAEAARGETRKGE